MRRYRLDVPLSRDLSVHLEELKREVFEKTGKRVTKGELVVNILLRFFDPKTPSSQEDACLSSKK